VGAFQMESFLDDKGHRDQAREIAATLLPKIEDKFTFDVLFFDLSSGITNDNQNQIVTLDGILVGKLRDDYDKAMSHKGSKPLPPDTSFANFIQHPDLFLDDESQSYLLADALNTAWELDSTSSGLSSAWKQGAGINVSPKDQDLSGIVLLNNDFSGIDFQEASSMRDAMIIGDCMINGTKIPEGVFKRCAK
jgi:hypothetical protein